MAKSKKKKGLHRKNASDKVGKRRDLKQVASESNQKSYRKTSENPFELKFNRKKHEVASGRKQLSQSVRVGAPNASRKRALDLRKETLLQEYRHVGKNNLLVDKRIGGNSSSQEERVAQRFALERMKRFDKKSAFRLDEDTEQLTHYGQSLADIQEHDKPFAGRINDHDEDEDGDAAQGAIEKDIVSKLHFGGGDFEDPNLIGLGGGSVKSRKDLIGELVSKSKMLKYEKQMQKDEQDDLTETLDDKWKEIAAQNLIGSLTKKKEDEEREKKVSDPFADYDSLFRELQFDTSRRGAAQDKLKTAEEIAQVERKRLEELEQERIARMQPTTSQQSTKDSILTSHRSADADDDNLDYGRPKKKVRFEIAYQDGKLIGGLDLPSLVKEGKKMAKKKSKEEKKDEGGPVDDSKSSEDAQIAEELLGKSAEKSEVKSTAPSSADSEIPFVIEAPASYEALVRVLEGKSAENQELVLERMIKCTHPGLKAGNKSRLEKLFLYTLRYFDTIAETPSVETTKLLDALTRVLYNLAQHAPEFAARCVRALLARHRDAHCTARRRWPSAACFSTLRLIPQLFPASDYWHPVVTPALQFACKMLTTVHNRSVTDVAKGLLLCAVICEYVGEAKRYCPELVAYVKGVLHVATEEHEEGERAPTGTFPLLAPYNSMLAANNSLSDQTMPEMVFFHELFATDEADDSDRVKIICLRNVMQIVRVLQRIYASLPSFVELGRDLQKQLQRLPLDNYPTALKENAEKLRKSLEQQLEKCAHYSLSFSQPQDHGLQMLEPRIERGFDPEKSHKGPRKGPKAERKRLQHKYKKEYRGTVRELRKDNKFLAREKTKDAWKKDLDRKQKTRQLMRGLAGQEGEYKKYKSKNK